ncbi:MAG: Na/Pi cotransporter family protein [Defluviitaleaceae bacterium]|nr:Na/Pi cotransporter family protein [Defluviitaleaceae bacterium]
MLGWQDIFMVLGGLGLFLFGMKIMSGGLEQAAGDKMQGILRKATSNRFLAVIVGIVATITINSSTAVTIMTVSFVNSGMLNLFQSIGIIMGANVGTTFSAQLIAFGVSDIAPIMIFIGAIIYIFGRTRRVKNIGYIVLGFGVLFFGVTVMGGPMRALRDNEAFVNFLVNFTNPLLALLAGMVFTAIIQSSTATTGILVALLLSGVPIPFTTTAFILLGVNIGTSFTTVIASIPANRESKRAALFHIMYDVIGSSVFGTVILLFPAILGWFTDTWYEPARQAAMFHMLYNFATMFLLLPFISYIAKLMEKIVPINEQNQAASHEKRLMYLDSPLNTKPSIAVPNAQLELCRMGTIANENFALAIEAFFENNDEKSKQVRNNEKIIDFLNHKIAAKLVSINAMRLNPTEAKQIGKMFIILADIERIGDHAANIADYAKDMNNNGLQFSEAAQAELKALAEKVIANTHKSLRVYETQDKKKTDDIKAESKKIRFLAENLIENHIERLKTGTCQPESGVLFTDMINDLERSSEHAKNIAASVSLEKKWNKKWNKK